MRMRIEKDRIGLLILAAYLMLATAYSIVNPLFESPDEVWHYEYVRWLVEGNGLASPEDVGHAPWHQEGSQPPLYYLAAAALTSWIPTDNAAEVIQYNPHAAVGQADSFGNKNVMVHGSAEEWPWRGVTLAAHIARFFSILLGAITVWVTYKTASLMRSMPTTKPTAEKGVANGLQTDWVALLAASIIAFNPQFLFLTAAVNNDNLVTCVCAVGLWYGLWLVRKSHVYEDHASTDNKSAKEPSDLHVALFGLLAGLAALSKLSGLLLSLFVALTLATIAWRRRSLGDLVRWGLISGITMVVVSGWWYARNWLLFGDPLALSAMFDILPRRAEPPTMDELIARAEGIWNSVWAVFGWFNVVVSPWIYWFYSAVTLVGVVGFAGLLIIRLRKSGNPDLSDSDLSDSDLSDSEDGHQGHLFLTQALLMLIWIGMLVASLWRWAQMRYPQGRLLYPALSALVVVIAIGLSQWLPKRLPKWLKASAFVSLVGVMFIIAAAVPWAYIEPSYRPLPRPLTIGEYYSALQENEAQRRLDAENPRQSEAKTPTLSIPTASFGGQIRLDDATISHSELTPGQKLTLTLNWRALKPLSQNQSVFVHLIDENEILQAQRDSYPGQGNLPTTEWEINEAVSDKHVIDIPLTVPSPSRLKVNIGLYNFATGERLLIGGSDHWTLGFVRLSPPPGDGTLPNSVFVNFEDKIALVGFEFDRFVMAPGDTLILKLWWEALDAPLRDIKVFTHLVLPPEATWAQDDDRPRAGTAKTDTWQLGDRIEDQYEMTLPDDAPSGVYFVEIGLYDGETYKRLKVNFSDKGTVIGQVRVAE